MWGIKDSCTLLPLSAFEMEFITPLECVLACGLIWPMEWVDVVLGNFSGWALRDLKLLTLLLGMLILEERRHIKCTTALSTACCGKSNLHEDKRSDHAKLSANSQPCKWAILDIPGRWAFRWFLDPAELTSWAQSSHRIWRSNNGDCCFKPLNSGIVCYSAIGNKISQILPFPASFAARWSMQPGLCWTDASHQALN